MNTKQDRSASNAYAMLQSLGSYLETSIERSSEVIEGRVSRGGERRTVKDEGHRIRITVSNTGPAEPTWPAIVFTGIGLVMEFATHPKSSMRKQKGQEVLRKMIKGGRLKVEHYSPERSWNPFCGEGAIRTDGHTFPHITPDEGRHGDCLFPGQSVVYELNVWSKECPDINDIHVWVEGTLSRRHLFHFAKGE